MKLFVEPPREGLWDDYPYIYKTEGFCNNKSDICDTTFIKNFGKFLEDAITKEINSEIIRKINEHRNL